MERGLDPFETDLVVADPERSKSTICLAITPAMKKKGVKNRCRIHEIPQGMEYITAVPRMQLYIDYSSRIYGIYLRYIAPEDIHVYSIDECFLDVTKYLKLYHMTPKEMAVELMDAVFTDTGITATAGVGTNLYLAKIAMDIVAKHADDHIGMLDEISYRERLWTHRPLSSFWMIGHRTERKLAQYGIHTMGDIARTSIVAQEWLYKMFGVDAELLIDHAWGIEPCRMEDIKNYRSSSHSLSHGQVLMRNYSFDEALVVIREMTDVLSLDLIDKGLATDSVTICVVYDHHFDAPPTGGTVNFGTPTDSSSRIIEGVDRKYRETTDPYMGIRRLNVTANRVVRRGYMQYDLFTDPLKLERERNLQLAMLSIKRRYGKNAVMRGCNLLACSTLRERNEQIGGHKK